MIGPAFSVREVAEMLGIRQHAVLAMIHAKSDQLPAVDISVTPGGRPHWRILSSDLEAFISRRTRKPVVPRRRRRKSAGLPVKRYF